MGWEMTDVAAEQDVPLLQSCLSTLEASMKTGTIGGPPPHGLR